MKTNFEKVKAFQRAFSLPVLDKPTIPADRVELRLSLIAEELVELREAIAAGDVVEVADALGDLAYVVYGMAAEFGIDIDACIRVIHAANMAKLGPDGKPIINDGVMRPDLPVGKVLKPAGWSAPDLREVLFGLSQSQPVLSPVGDTEAPLSGGWRGIESAPKDALLLLWGLLDPHPQEAGLHGSLDRPSRAAGYWDDIDQAWSLAGSTWLGPWFKPTHWMPLPEPPAKGTLTKGEGAE